MSDYLKITEMASKSLERWITQAPPKREWVELTDAEIKSARDFVGFSYEIGEELHYFARHLETKLKEKNS